MGCAIQIENLRKSYGEHLVLKGLNLRIEEGEIFGLLGINGAGKTTAFECIEGLRKYDSGRITVNGKMGIQLQSSSLPAYIKPQEAVLLFANWNGTAADPSILAALGIHELEKKQYRELSMGQKRRLHLALALVGNPDLVFLDEPTAGLDVEGRISLHVQIRLLKEQGKTILLASHDMAEVEALCDRIAILNKGNLAFLGTVDELTASIGRRYNIKIITKAGEEDYAAENIGEAMLDLLEGYKKRNLTVLDIKIDRGTLEEHFINIAKGE